MAHLAYQQALQWPDRLGSICLRGAGSVIDDGGVSMPERTLMQAKHNADGLFQPAPTSTRKSLQAIRLDPADVPSGDATDEQPLFRQSLRNLWAIKVSE